ncbi:hypothetical protein V8E36_006791 [Tilletia maclaganii]
MPRIVVVNPNSSEVITEALERTLRPTAPSTCTYSFRTGPPTSPASIQSAVDGVLSAAYTFESLSSSAEGADANLVCCFSNHPLVGMLRSAFPMAPAMHILEAGVLHALPLGQRFGIITTGSEVVGDIDRGVRDILGANSYRYIGTLATNLGVLELQTATGAGREKVNATLRAGARSLVERGAEVVILGCAGMTGMESVIRAGAAEASLNGGGRPIAVIDGAKAGIQILAGLAATAPSYFA